MEEKRFELSLNNNRSIDIEFERITFTTKENRGKKNIIDGVSGKFLSGELTAIMGPSGAGKTTLLNILTGLQVKGTKGTIRCSNAKKKNGALQYKKQSCYILQDDNLPSLFTVMEVMHMAVKLKLKGISKKATYFLIDDILDSLSLINSKNTRCQDLSGGQRKRLSVALELINNPPIMFLDEPTTGLDSSSSTQCVHMLKNLALGGRTIICTIHQPSAILYKMFDHVYVMTEGKCAYQGSSGNIIPYLASVGFNCPQYHNPADYFMEVVSGEYGNYTEILVEAARSLKWRRSVPRSEFTFFLKN